MVPYKIQNYMNSLSCNFSSSKWNFCLKCTSGLSSLCIRLCCWKQWDLGVHRESKVRTLMSLSETPKWNRICPVICLNSEVLLSKLSSLLSYGCLPHREGGERDQFSTGGNCHSSNIPKLWQFSPAKDLSKEVQVVSVRDFVHVIMMRFLSLNFSQVLPQGDYFKSLSICF